MPTRPTQMRLTEDDKVILDELKRYYRLTETTETIRRAIRDAIAYRDFMKKFLKISPKRA